MCVCLYVNYDYITQYPECLGLSPAFGVVELRVEAADTFEFVVLDLDHAGDKCES